MHSQLLLRCSLEDARTNVLFYPRGRCPGLRRAAVGGSSSRPWFTIKAITI